MDADHLFDFGYLTNGYGPPVLGGLLALGGERLPMRVSGMGRRTLHASR